MDTQAATSIARWVGALTQFDLGSPVSVKRLGAQTTLSPWEGVRDLAEPTRSLVALGELGKVFNVAVEYAEEADAAGKPRPCPSRRTSRCQDVQLSGAAGRSQNNPRAPDDERGSWPGPRTVQVGSAPWRHVHGTAIPQN